MSWAVENPYLQGSTGKNHLQTEPLIDPSSLMHWRNRMGEIRSRAHLKAESERPMSSGKSAAAATLRESLVAEPVQRRAIHITATRPNEAILVYCSTHTAIVGHGYRLRCKVYVSCTRAGDGSYPISMRRIKRGASPNLCSDTRRRIASSDSTNADDALGNVIYPVFVRRSENGFVACDFSRPHVSHSDHGNSAISNLSLQRHNRRLFRPD